MPKLVFFKFRCILESLGVSSQNKVRKKKTQQKRVGATLRTQVGFGFVEASQVQPGLKTAFTLSSSTPFHGLLFHIGARVTFLNNTSDHVIPSLETPARSLIAPGRI